jgi:hypothetical protein
MLWHIGEHVYCFLFFVLYVSSLLCHYLLLIWWWSQGKWKWNCNYRFFIPTIILYLFHTYILQPYVENHRKQIVIETFAGYACAEKANNGFSSRFQHIWKCIKLDSHAQKHCENVTIHLYEVYMYSKYSLSAMLTPMLTVCHWPQLLRV